MFRTLVKHYYSKDYIRNLHGKNVNVQTSQGTLKEGMGVLYKTYNCGGHSPTYNKALLLKILSDFEVQILYHVESRYVEVEFPEILTVSITSISIPTYKKDERVDYHDGFTWYSARVVGGPEHFPGALKYEVVMSPPLRLRGLHEDPKPSYEEVTDMRWTMDVSDSDTEEDWD